MVHTRTHNRSSDPAQRFRDKVKRKRDKEQARDARIAERDIAGGKFQAEGKAVSRFDIERIKRETGTSQDPAPARRAEREREAQKGQIVERGVFEKPELVTQEQLQQVPTEEEERLGFRNTELFQRAQAAAGFITGTTPREVLPSGEFAPTQPGTLLGGGVPIVPAAAVTGLFKVGADKFSNPQKAIQAATKVKTAAKSSGALKILKDFQFLIGGTLAFGGLSVKGLLDKSKEQQQALNTLGEVTSSIVGDSTTGAGNIKDGKVELFDIQQAILDHEQAIKFGGILSSTVRISGRIIDLNADIQSQLATVNEGLSDLREFELQGLFPELSPQETQELVRELEEEGLIKRVDITTSRR